MRDSDYSGTRRRFLRDTGLVALGAGLMPMGLRAAPSDTINIGVIGCNGMGWSNMVSMLRVDGTRCVALCDVDANVLKKRVSAVTKGSGNTPRTYADYRALLDDKDVDAVIIATPDHWHCLQMVDACSAGKDVYVEKPMANSIDEIDRMVRAAEYHKRVVQVGQWQRSGIHWQEAIDHVHSGVLGRIRSVKAWAYLNMNRKCDPIPDAPAPKGVDYDMWLGPAPSRPFNRNRFHWNFRWFWDYAGGLMTDWGVHLIDIVLWGMQAQFPHRVMSSGGKFAYPDSAMETPDTQTAIYEYDGFSMIWEHAMGVSQGPYQRGHGVAFIGNNGTLVVDRRGWEIYPETEKGRGEPVLRMEAPPARVAKRGETGLNQHTEDFIQCMRNRGTPRCDVRTGSLAAVNAHLGNIALKTGDTLDWRAERNRFDGNRAANALLKPRYRRPWRLPDV